MVIKYAFIDVPIDKDNFYDATRAKRIMNSNSNRINLAPITMGEAKLLMKRRKEWLR